MRIRLINLVVMFCAVNTTCCAAEPEQIAAIKMGTTVGELTFSPDSKTLAIATVGGVGTKNEIRLWDVEKKQDSDVVIDAPVKPWSCLKFSPNGKQLATGSMYDKHAFIFDATTGKLATKIPHMGIVWNARWTLDGKSFLTAEEYGYVRVWDMATQKPTFEQRPTIDRSFTVAVSPNGKFLAGGTRDGHLNLWNLQTKKHISKTKYLGMLYGLAFTPDGKYIVTAGSNVQLWDGQTGAEQYKFEDSGPHNDDVSVTADSRFILVATHEQARLWDIQTKKLVLKLPAHSSAAISPDGRYVAVDEFSTVKVFDVSKITAGAGVTSSSTPPRPNPPANDTEAGVSAIVSSTSFQSNLTRVRALLVSPDGSQLAMLGMGKRKDLWSIRVVSAKDGSLVRETHSPRHTIGASLDWKLLFLTSLNGNLEMQDLATGENVTRLGPITPTAIYAEPGNNTIVVPGSSDKLPGRSLFFIVPARKELAGVVASRSLILESAFIPEQKCMAFVTQQGALTVWNFRQDKQVDVILEPGGLRSKLSEVDATSDGKWVAWNGTSIPVSYWSRSSGIQQLEGTTSSCHTLGIFAKSAKVAAPSGEAGTEVGVYDLETGRSTLRLKAGGKSPVQLLRVSSDESRVVALDANNAIHIWDVANPPTPEPIQQPPTSPVFRTWTSADGKFTVEATLVSSANGRIKLRKKSNGQVIEVPISALSKSDQEFVDEM